MFFCVFGSCGEATPGGGSASTLSVAMRTSGVSTGGWVWTNGVAIGVMFDACGVNAGGDIDSCSGTRCTSTTGVKLLWGVL